MLLKKIHNERGVALIAALGISLILMVVAIAIAYNVGIFTRITSTVKKKDQTVFTADYGLESLRYYLWESWCPPPQWGGLDGSLCEDGAGGGNNIPFPAYADLTPAMMGKSYYQNMAKNIYFTSNENLQFSFNQTPPKGVIEMIKDGVAVPGYTYDFSVFAKQSNNPEILYTMVSAVKRPASGFEANENRYTDRVTIEAALHFSVPCPDDYKQFGQCKSKEGRSDEEVLNTGTINPM